MPALRPTAVVPIVALLLALSLHAGAASAAAATGDYNVRLTTTSGSFWRTYGRGPFITAPQRVHSGVGSFQAGDYASWRAVVPGEGSRIVGGRIVVTLTTPHENMRGRIVVGTGNSPVVLYDGGATGTVSRTIASGAHDWLQFDLRSAGAATTTRVAENHINFAEADVILRDSVPPVVSAISLPSAATWHSASACIPFSIRLTDQGGGLLRSQVRRAHDGVVVTELGTTQVQSLKPGPTEQHLNDCIQPHERGHGDTTFVATAWDVGGTARELAFSVRADHAGPSIHGGPADGSRFTVSRPVVLFEVADQGSGVAAVSATLDGASVPVHLSGNVASLELGSVPIGSHTLVVAARDHAGNDVRIERRFSVADATPPTLTLESPGDRGEASAFLSVRATDDMSGVDPARWVATVNGEPVPVRADQAQLTATIGPLSPGVQRIEVRAADRAGNVAMRAHAYEVVSAPVPSMPNVGARTGAVLVDGPTDVVRYGRQASVAIHVSRNGRPMSGQLVQVDRDGVTLASASSDEHGVARIAFRVGAPGRYQAKVAGLSMDPVDVPLRIAPQIAIRTSTARPRVGQRVRLTGRVVPAIAGRRVVVEARTGRVWYPIRRTAAIRPNGTFRASVAASARGTVWVRVRLRPTAGWTPVASNERALVVRAAARRPSRR